MPATEVGTLISEPQGILPDPVSHPPPPVTNSDAIPLAYHSRSALPPSHNCTTTSTLTVPSTLLAAAYVPKCHPVPPRPQHIRVKQGPEAQEDCVLVRPASAEIPPFLPS